MRKGILFILVFIACVSSGQVRYYANPVNIPLLLSGSFAELRGGHFHAGIDIKTQGTTGLPIFSAADGYISRIAVSPGGYGRALYINHPNGTTTVYAHLSRFSKAIEDYIKKKQYEAKSFRIDLHPSQFLFPVKQGEEIAKSGNSGSSGGPHLHFEIRDTHSQEPLNPLNFNFPVKDTIAPKIFSVLVVPLTKDSHVNYSGLPRSYPVVYYDGKYHLKGNPAVPVWGKIGIGVQTNDYFNGSYNKCGINLLRTSLDDLDQFTFQIHRFSFNTTRYINSHIVYDEYVSSKRKFIKTWLEPGNQLPIYNHNGSMGVLTPQADKTHLVGLELQDSYGNTSVLEFSIQGKEKKMPLSLADSGIPFRYNEENHFSNNEVKLSIPKGALYADFDFFYTKQASTDKFLSDFYSFHNNTIPLHKSAKIKIKAEHIPDALKSKVVLARVTIEDRDTSYSAAGGTLNEGWIESSTMTLGTYAIMVDTIPPEIVPLSIKNEQLTESTRIRFKISDDFAGIQAIEGTLDGRWALFEYDPKSNRITHYFDKERFGFNKSHRLKVTVTDYRGNTAVYESSFWK